MPQKFIFKVLILSTVFLGLWFFIRFLFPFFLPFLVGLALAAGAEPMVQFLKKKLHLPRPAAAFLAITAGAVLVLSLAVLPATVLVRHLQGLLPSRAVQRQQLSALEQQLLTLFRQAPPPLDQLLGRGVGQLFSDWESVLGHLAEKLPGLATGIASHLADALLFAGTALLSGFMLCVRRLRMRQLLRCHLPEAFRRQVLPVLTALKKTLTGWLLAQLKLTAAAAGLLMTGFIILGISPAPLWACLVALVDAVPMLGTGTVLVPWSLLALLQGDQFRFIGLMCIYAVTAVSRSLLEPKLLGKDMGLDPLLALAALYGGYRLWGVGGMLLLPPAAAIAMQLLRLQQEKSGRP